MRDSATKYGLLGGLSLIVFLLGLYFVDKKLLTNGMAAYWLPLLLVHPPFMYMATTNEIAQHGKKDFRAWVRTPFLVFAVANAMYWICQYALHLSDPSLAQMELNLQLAHAQEQLKQGLGDPQAMYKIRESIAQIEAELKNIQQPVGPYLFSMVIWNILGFGIASGITGWLRSR
jgi:hypothetical protein